MLATRTLESIPPERNAPTGTSATRRLPTARSNSLRTSAAASGSSTRMRSRGRIPDREREHPVEALDERLAIALVEMDNDLRVRARLERVALGSELVAQLREVVDLPVEDRPDPAALVALRLIPGDEIDDAQ